MLPGLRVLKACQTVIDGDHRPTAVPGAVPDYHSIQAMPLNVDIPQGKLSWGSPPKIQNCGLHDRSEVSFSGRVMMFVRESGNFNLLMPAQCSI